MTGLRNFCIYMNKLLTIDAFFLNEDVSEYVHPIVEKAMIKKYPR